jgi:hypothetical protein
MNQLRVFSYQLTNSLDIIAPYCVDQMTRLNQPRPTRNTIAPRQRELRISEFNFIRFYPDGFRM